MIDFDPGLVHRYRSSRPWQEFLSPWSPTNRNQWIKRHTKHPIYIHIYKYRHIYRHIYIYIHIHIHIIFTVYLHISYFYWASEPKKWCPGQKALGRRCLSTHQLRVQYQGHRAMQNRAGNDHGKVLVIAGTVSLI